MTDIYTRESEDSDTNPPMSTGRNVREALFKVTRVKPTSLVKLSGSLLSHNTHTHITHYGNMNETIRRNLYIIITSK